MNRRSQYILRFLKHLLLPWYLTLLAGVPLVYASDTSVMDRVKSANTPFDMDSVKSHPVTAKTVVAKEQYQGGSFRVLSRKDQIERFKCSTCHNEKEITVRQAGALTHDITINHGTEGNELTCIDCHHEEKRDYLEDKKGRKIDFDHSYQLCGQCHFRQKRDWVGGAHGKRVTYWAGSRVVYNCASCHNPHSPRFEKRFPATYSKPMN